MVDKAKGAGLITSEVIAQSGCTTYEPQNEDFTLEPFVGQTRYQELINQAELVITHGGLSSIADSINAHKRTLVVPRRQHFDEHQNDHQLEIMEKYAHEGYIVACGETDDFAEALATAHSYTPRPYQSTSSSVLKLVRAVIDDAPLPAGTLTGSGAQTPVPPSKGTAD